MKKMNYFFNTFTNFTKSNLFLLLMIAVLGSSCEMDLPANEVNYKDRIVLNLLANNDQFLSVHVAKTLPIYDSAAETVIENAKVTVTQEGGAPVPLTFSFLNGGKYVSNFKPQPGLSYSIQVEAPNLPTCYSRFIMPKTFIGSKSVWEDNTGLDASGFPIGTISFEIRDDVSQRNFYEIALYRYEDIAAEFLEMPILPLDAELSQSPKFNKAGALLVDDASFNGERKSFKFSTPFGSAGSQFKYLVVVKSLSQDYFKYFESLEDYQVQGGAFSDPIPVFNNIINGVGIAAGACVQRDTIK
jgi:hypothetical protein